MSRAEREQDLITYYSNEIQDRVERDLPEPRVTRRTAYLDQLRAEGRNTVLELGCGPGRDGEAIAAAGFSYTGVDLSPASVEACRELGLHAEVASVLDLPFDDATFDAGWTMSTLLHVADEDLDQALQEIIRVLRPGAPLAVGLWGDVSAHEHVWEDGKGYGPGRFFSIRSDEGLREVLGRYGAVEQWTTWDDDRVMHYQWAVLRVSAS
ncbi:methyltransferase family protein [Kribbella sp. VKM Ac-2571]|uniref:class I SAM-dependent methyltransferase n=1 Tax=Kribbella sp. VKM Ac-2571 TaxID=2512222 RepID=UPI0010CEF330|nr:class I SAM-dependent methyltransferase [Kribbella sp. VKM Ac-2571]TDO54185.1 methyltransferase family protein [Kribbella sp. VKM Ac-2571]